MQVSIPFKRETTSQEAEQSAVAELLRVSIPFKRENGAQVNESEVLTDEDLFPFPSNGNAEHKPEYYAVTLESTWGFHSLQTGNQSTSDTGKSQAPATASFHSLQTGNQSTRGIWNLHANGPGLFPFPSNGKPHRKTVSHPSERYLSLVSIPFKRETTSQENRDGLRLGRST